MLSDLKRRQAEKLERLLGQNEHRLARIEKENQVSIGKEKFTIPLKKKWSFELDIFVNSFSSCSGEVGSYEARE